MNNRDAAMNRCIEELETDMELLGITGVEGKPIISSKLINLLFLIDKLQNEVAVTIEALRSASI
jgi:magnesium-transporting ATPase (P-type)